MPTLRHDETQQALRLATRVARLYHERHLTQPDIARQLGVSQARVSRMLKFAEANGIVRTTVHPPPGIFSDLEDELQRIYGLAEAVVVDTGEPKDDDVIPVLASSAAAYFEAVIPSCQVVGVSSWSETLLAAVDVMRPVHAHATTHVVQVLGGVGRANSQVFATRLTERLAHLANARAVFLLAPGVVSSPEVHGTLVGDALCRDVFSYYRQLTLLMVGIGSLTPSRLLRDSGNVLDQPDLEALRQKGAVGDICLRFFDKDGQFIQSPFDDRVLGIDQEQIFATPRRVAVAGGMRKFESIRAALRGKWVTTLITDLGVAKALIANP